MTSKEQERKALAQIKKIVESLGEDSYIATAFEGCFKDAEDNIEHDAAFSMSDRWKSELENSRSLSEAIDQLKLELKGKESELENAKKLAITEDTLCSLVGVVSMRMVALRNDRDEAAERVLEHIKNDASPEAVKAKADYIKAKHELEKMSELLKTVSRERGYEE